MKYIIRDLYQCLQAVLDISSPSTGKRYECRFYNALRRGWRSLEMWILATALLAAVVAVAFIPDSGPGHDTSPTPTAVVYPTATHSPPMVDPYPIVDPYPAATNTPRPHESEDDSDPPPRPTRTPPPLPTMRSD